MAPTAMDDLVKKRESLRSRILTVQTKVNTYNPALTTIAEMKIIFTGIEGMRTKLDELYEETFMECATSADFATHQTDFDTYFHALDVMGAKVSGIIAPTTAAPPPTTAHALQPQPLKIPVFSGKPEEWQSFHDLFESGVNSTTLSGSQKLAYLKSLLKGDAASMVQYFQLTDGNYTEAWNLLKARYQNTHEMINTHIRTLIDFKPIQKENADNIRLLLNTTKSCVGSIKVLGAPVEHWDLIIIFHVTQRMASETIKQWALQKSQMPTLKELLDFLEARAHALASIPTHASSAHATTSKGPSSHHVATNERNQRSQSKTSSKRPKRAFNVWPCPKCSEAHHLYNCEEYKAFSVQEKINFVKQKKLCTNCLSSNHTVDSCTNTRSCYKCGNRHHTTIHKDSATESTPVSSSHCAISSPRDQVVLLGTLLVDVKDSRGLVQQCRVFVDNGSESHFITEHCLNRLGLRKRKVHIPLNAIGHEPGPTAKAQASFTLQSRSESFELEIHALVLPKFAGLIPAKRCQARWNHLEKVALSDPNFHQPHFTDILLGAAKTGHIMLPGVITHPTNPIAPVALNTRFGWMINGEAPALQPGQAPRSIHHVTLASDNQNLDELLSKFWTQEEPEPHQTLQQSASDVECEKHFMSTHSLNPDGTYTVQLPFRSDAPKLGKSRDTAIRRFLNVEKRLNTQPDIKAEYTRIINEYISLGYMEPVPPDDMSKPCSAVYYMPHHEVLKPSSNTTKVRVVYDASAKTSTKVSLNEILHTGPKLQVDLCPLLLRFMTYQVAMSADIWKFYPQTTIYPDQQDFQRLVWRENPDQPIQDFRLTRATFGVSSACFLAIRALHELANRVSITQPAASYVLKHEFLVDNLLSGGNTLQAAIRLKDQLLQTMKIGGLKLLQFTSNSEALLDSMPPELRDPSCFHAIDERDEVVRTIGILWNPRLDTFSIKIKVPEAPMVTTKRTVLSTIAKTFDPLGWLSPVTITPKIMMQNLWKAGLTWDEPLPLHFHQEWRKYCEDLPSLNGFSLPRNAFAPPDSNSYELTYQLHGFSDGSNLAHAACVYVRTEDSNGKAAVKLVTAKTKVNPVNKMTTPRSELCGALLLANLMATAQAAFKTEFTSVHCWSDSTVVLGRLSPEKKLPVFELNRIRKILDLLPPLHWGHVKGEENPADAPSRGIPPRQLLTHPLWLNGPPWLLDFHPEPQPPSVSIATVNSQPVTDFIMACSSFDQMRRRVAYILRFIHNTRSHKANRRSGPLSPTELQLGLISILKLVQYDAFSKEIQHCSQGLVVKSRLKFWTPYLDPNGVLRVGGRLENADIPFTQKHPALLPKNDHVVDVIARHYHKVNLHAGPTLLLSILREQFWPVSGLRLTKRVVRKCVTCHRQQAVTATQLMGQLPSTRVNPSPTFQQSGVDYAGPFLLNLRTGRNPPVTKSYVAVFICMATKATHLELVSYLSSAAFIAALTRFLSRRGLPSDVYSDEGTNFVGAKKELDELLYFVNSEAHVKTVREFLLKKGISFHTNPPAAPHHGGLWEAAVKSMKYHLRRVMGTRHLTVEEFSTLLCQVEAMLNSRPLTPLSDDPNDVSALTPGHFLTGRPLTALPYPDLRHLPISQLDRWQTVQCLTQNIWDSWRSNYLSILQSRPKWYSPLPDLTPGTLVLLLDKDSSLGPQEWKLGRIVKTYPGNDGKTRVCDVRTNITVKNPAGSILKRPVVKLSPLPIY